MIRDYRDKAFFAAEKIVERRPGNPGEIDDLADPDRRIPLRRKELQRAIQNRFATVRIFHIAIIYRTVRKSWRTQPKP